MNGISRLLTLKEENDAKGADMRLEAPRFLAMAQRHELGTAPRAVIGFNLFQTPRLIAAQMAEILKEKIRPGARILEPSAGLGRLFEPLQDLAAQWVAVEESRECFKALEKMMQGAKMQNRDFLTATAGELGGQFDGVIMNPPFKQGRDIKHILHALEMVRPGGRLVSLCYNGAKQNAQLKPIATRWEILPANSFKEEGTGADVALFVMDK
jgi:predicted RNA methylase